MIAELQKIADRARMLWMDESIDIDTLQSCLLGISEGIERAIQIGGDREGLLCVLASWIHAGAGRGVMDGFPAESRARITEWADRWHAAAVRAGRSDLVRLTVDAITEIGR